jgi:hypothetical protein
MEGTPREYGFALSSLHTEETTPGFAPTFGVYEGRPRGPPAPATETP